MNTKIINAYVESITPLTNSILQLILSPEEYIDYKAGQYLQILLNNERFSFSIANAPLGSRKYELHIRHNNTNDFHQKLIEEIKKTGQLAITLPLGTCDLDHLDPNKPIIFIAAGTGFAPIKAIIEQLLTEDRNTPFELYWAARSQSDLYMDSLVSSWQNHVNNFQYFSKLSDINKTSLASSVFERHPSDLKNWQIVIHGPFEMVYNVRDELVNHQIKVENIFSDAFAFEAKKI